jgi:hypothetical protein
MKSPIVRIIKLPVVSSLGSVLAESIRRSASLSLIRRTRQGCTLWGEGEWIAVASKGVQTLIGAKDNM